jgi:hypothetical protein
MIKIRLKLLDSNTSGSFTKAPKPNSEGEGENVMISDTIIPLGLSYKQRPLNNNGTSSSLKIGFSNYKSSLKTCPATSFSTSSILKFDLTIIK